jgi:hypothetical protein
MASGIVPPMTSFHFLSTAPVVMILAGVALLAVAGAVTVAPIGRFERGRSMMFMFCQASIWAVAVLVIWLIKRTI